MIAQFKQQVTFHQIIFLASLAGFSCITTGLILLGNSFENKLFPNTYINSIDVSALTLSQSITVLEKEQQKLEPHTLVLQVDDISLASSSAELGYSIDFTNTVQKVYEQQHKRHPIVTATHALLANFRTNKHTAPKIYNVDSLNQFLTEFNTKVELIGENPSLTLKTSGTPSTLSIFVGEPGRTLNTTETQTKILSQIQDGTYEIQAEIASTSSVLTQESSDLALQRVQPLIGKTMQFTAQDEKFTLNDQDIISFINPLGGYQDQKLSSLLDSWSEEINRPAQNATFEYDSESLEVKEFTPHKDGLELNKTTAQEQVLALLADLEANPEEFEEIPLELPLKKTAPEVTLEQTNGLGIKERIGFGESYYHHSIINRVHNVNITAERISLTIVPPGKEFSFNKTLGEVSARTGYRSAYVISGGKTILGDGGGVCQVSSTLFRSVLDAGLDVSKRLQHSYRVSYYELNSDPGFDATVYSGDIDFKFINDTPNHIIIVTHVEEENRYMNIEIYGTDDGRTAEIHDYKKWGQVGPPPTEYFPTNELPSGVKEQIDWSVSGVKTEFKHTVKDIDGNIIHDDTYYSNYRPWSAKYRVGI